MSFMPRRQIAAREAQKGFAWRWIWEASGGQAALPRGLAGRLKRLSRTVVRPDASHKPPCVAAGHREPQWPISYYNLHPNFPNPHS